MEKHDHHCENADVGSVCDCHCAGAKHAVLHTKGGVPGAGAVTQAAQKAAHAAERPVVVNGKATPKDGSRIAPGAPKAFKVEHDERQARAAAAQKAAGDTKAARATPEATAGRAAAEKALREAHLASARHDAQLRDRLKAGGAKDVLGAINADPEGKRLRAAHAAAGAKARDAGVDVLAAEQKTHKILAAEQQKAAAPPADKGDMTVTTRRRNGAEVPSTATKDGAAVQVPPADPAVKVPAALRDVLDVLDNPDAADMTAASRYQKLTPALLKQMTGEQKQKMLDDIRARVKAGKYTAKHATGQKFERGYNTLTFGSSDLKEGMKGADNFTARAGDKVTHPEFGHGKVTSKTSQGGKTAAVVDFGDRTETVPHTSLTFGHVGADTSPAVKQAAAGKAAAGRTAAAGKKLTDFADRVTAYDNAVTANDHVAKARLDTKIGSSRKAYSALGEFNDISTMSPETFKALPPADQAKVVGAVKRIAHTYTAPEVQHRVSDTLHAWTGKGIDVAPTADPEHVVQAKRALAGQSTTLPASMAIARVDDHSLKNRFTPAERAQLRHRAQTILAGMKDNAPDRAGLRSFVDRVDQLDGADSSPAGLMARARQAEFDSTDPRLPPEKRRQARTDMHDLRAQAFNAENPHRTPGVGADTFRGKKVKELPPTQQPVLEAVAAGSGYRALPGAAVSNLQRTGHIQTTMSNDRAYLTEDGHIKLAAQRGDAHHQKLNEKVAELRDAHDQAGKAVQVHTASRGQDPYDRTWSRRSQEVQQQQQQAYGRWQLAINERNAHAAGPGTGGAAPDSVNGRNAVRDSTERVISRDTPGGQVTDTAKPAGTKPADTKPAGLQPVESPALAAKRAELAAAEKAMQEHGARQAGSGSMRTKRFGQQVDAHVRGLAQHADKVKKLQREVSALEKPAPVSRVPEGGFTPAHLADKKYVKTRWGWFEVAKVNRVSVKVKSKGPGEPDSIALSKILDAR